MKKGSILSLNWYMLGLRGLTTVLFGISTLWFYPTATVQVRILLFASFALLYGIYSVWALFGFKMTVITILEILQGLISAIIGLAAFFSPNATNTSLLFLIAIWAVIIGSIKILLSCIWEKEIPRKLFSRSAGIISFLFGLFLIIKPQSDISIIGPFVGMFMVIFGSLIVAFAVDLPLNRNTL